MTEETVPVPKPFSLKEKLPAVSMGKYGRYKGNIPFDKLVKLAGLQPAKIYNDIKPRTDVISSTRGAWSSLEIPFLESEVMVNVPYRWIEYLESEYGYVDGSLPVAHDHSIRMAATCAISKQIEAASPKGLSDPMLWCIFMDKFRDFESQVLTMLTQAQCSVDFEYKYARKAAGSEARLSPSEVARLFGA